MLAIALDLVPGKLVYTITRHEGSRAMASIAPSLVPGATHCAATFQLPLRLYSHHRYIIANR